MTGEYYSEITNSSNVATPAFLMAKVLPVCASPCDNACIQKHVDDNMLVVANRDKNDLPRHIQDLNNPSRIPGWNNGRNPSPSRVSVPVYVDLLLSTTGYLCEFLQRSS